MPKVIDASPRLSVWLFKNIDRQVNGATGSASESARYAGEDPYIDLTPLLGAGSSVRTSKSTREPSGGFSISFPDRPHKDWLSVISAPGFQSLESLYGLVEPMDIVEIRMWSGVGSLSLDLNYPIIMRGFVSEVSRSQAMSDDGMPQRMVTISGQDYGKIWQTYQVLYLPNYAEGKPLLTTYALSELFGVAAVNAMKAPDFIRAMVTQIINPHLALMLEGTPLDVQKEIKTGSSISVQHGMVGQSFQNQQGSLYDIMKFHGDVGTWNELYTEDREDGVHCVYRSLPYRMINGNTKIFDDSPSPVYVEVEDVDVQSISVARTDANVANFYWVDSSKFDMISDISRKLHSLPAESVSLADYPNAAKKYYGVRAMYASTQQGGDSVTNQGGGVSKDEKDSRDAHQMSWVDKRRYQLIQTNKDNVVMERGSARVKGCPTRGAETAGTGRLPIKAGEYARFHMGGLMWQAYVYQVDHEFVPYQGYTTTLLFERGTGFVERVSKEGIAISPWLAEQVS